MQGPGVSIVNHVGFEDYLKGIAEMPSKWPAEALRAQAIAARTYALHVMGTGSLGGQICASEACQVYAGLAKETAPGGANWAAAVDATRGQVVLHGGKPILAKYSSSNGGTSVDGGKPYLKAQPDPDDAAQSAAPLGADPVLRRPRPGAGRPRAGGRRPPGRRGGHRRLAGARRRPRRGPGHARRVPVQGGRGRRPRRRAAPAPSPRRCSPCAPTTAPGSCTSTAGASATASA